MIKTIEREYVSISISVFKKIINYLSSIETI